MIVVNKNGQLKELELVQSEKSSVSDFVKILTPEDSFVNISNINIRSLIETEENHYDGIQIIPRSIFFNSQYYGFSAGNFFFHNVSIYSKNSLQGIFCSDGAIDSFQISNSLINVGSTHSISLSGCRIFKGSNLKLSSPVKLYPLRVLGNFSGKENIYISLDDASLYTDSSFEVLDYRKDPSFLRSGDIFLYNFNFKKFEESIIEFLTKNNSNSLAKNLKAAKKIVLSHGDL